MHCPSCTFRTHQTFERSVFSTPFLEKRGRTGVEKGQKRGGKGWKRGRKGVEKLFCKTTPFKLPPSYPPPNEQTQTSPYLPPYLPACLPTSGYPPKFTTYRPTNLPAYLPKPLSTHLHAPQSSSIPTDMPYLLFRMYTQLLPATLILKKSE